MCVVRKDLEIGGGQYSLLRLLKRMLQPRFRALFALRVYQSSSNLLVKWFCRLYSDHIANKYGYELPVQTQVGPGLWLPHPGQFVVNRQAILGCNVCIHPWVLIGGMRGKGAPIIGDNVFIGSGTKIIGNVRVGNNVFIAPNSVVVKDVEDGATIAGNPAKVINNNGGINVSLYLFPNNN